MHHAAGQIDLTHAQRAQVAQPLPAAVEAGKYHPTPLVIRHHEERLDLLHRKRLFLHAALVSPHGLDASKRIICHDARIPTRLHARFHDLEHLVDGRRRPHLEQPVAQLKHALGLDAIHRQGHHLRREFADRCDHLGVASVRLRAELRLRAFEPLRRPRAEGVRGERRFVELLENIAHHPPHLRLGLLDEKHTLPLFGEEERLAPVEHFG